MRATQGVAYCTTSLSALLPIGIPTSTTAWLIVRLPACLPACAYLFRYFSRVRKLSGHLILSSLFCSTTAAAPPDLTSHRHSANPA
ncbi:hypothetical protein BKA80DRAFT_109056 [Phyllosticta citrichinensis]